MFLLPSSYSLMENCDSGTTQVGADESNIYKSKINITLTADT